MPLGGHGGWIGDAAARLLAGVALALAAAPVSPAAECDLAPGASCVRVESSGTATAAPDRAVLHVAVLTEAGTARQAATENARKADALLKALREALGSAARVETSGYALTPRYDRSPEGSAPKLAGYAAGNTLKVTLDDLTLVGRAIDAALGAGANDVQSLSFTLRDEGPVRTRALTAAAIQAKAEADAVAEALGLKVVRVVSLVEGGETRPPVPMFERMTAQTAGAPPTPVDPGLVEFQAHVVLTAEVGPR